MKKGVRLHFFEVIKLFIKKIRLSTLIMLIVTLSSSSFAWFIYATKVSTGVTAYIEAWNIKFTAEDNNIEKEVLFEIENIYPGMETDVKSITVNNIGDKTADVRYRLVSAKILGVSYIVNESLTSEQLENKLANQFPFKILFSIVNEQIGPYSGTTTFSVTVKWDYESGNDELDTVWGKDAYNFADNNPGQPSIELAVLVSAVQSQG